MSDEIYASRYAAQEACYATALREKDLKIEALEKKLAAEEKELNAHQRLCYFVLKEEYETQPGFDELFRDIPKNNAELNAVLVLVREAENTRLKQLLFTATNLANEREKMLERLAPIADLLQQVEQTAAESEQVKRVAQEEIDRYKQAAFDMGNQVREAEKKYAEGRRVINRAYNMLHDELQRMPEHAYGVFNDFLAEPVKELARVCRLFPENAAETAAVATSDAAAAEQLHKKRKV